MTKKNDEKLYRRYTVRLFPTPEQEELMWKHVYAARFIWNHFYFMQEKRYFNGKKYLSCNNMCKDITLLKKECGMEWLNEVSNDMLQQVCRSLDSAYQKFFQKISGLPKPKKKNKTTNSFPIGPRGESTYFINENYIKIAKFEGIKYKADFNISGICKYGYGNGILAPQIEYKKSSKKWILTFSMEHNNQVMKLIDKSMGIDLGVKELAVVAVGDKKLVFGNINKSKRMRTLEKKRRYIKRVIDRKYRTFNNHKSSKDDKLWEKSKNIEKYEQILREIYAKQSNIRKNYIHQITRQLVNMLPERVVMEDLNVRGMMKNKYLSKSISEQNFHYFIQCMKYKCEEYGIEFVQADCWFPSSKTCSDCGYVNKNLKLKDRTYICPNCGLKIDRDHNAAINLMNYTENSTTANYLVSAKLSA